MRAAVPDRPLTMHRPDLDKIPRFDLPAGFAMRPYQPGDAETWFRIQRAADQLTDITPQLFRQEFGDDETMLRRRQLYLLAPGGRAIGTTSAWVDAQGDPAVGRVHWVAIVPEFQGRGLARPLLAHTCRLLRHLGHKRACLTTSTARLPAINLYLKFGFQPHRTAPEDEAAWREIVACLKY